MVYLLSVEFFRQPVSPSRSSHGDRLRAASLPAQLVLPPRLLSISVASRGHHPVGLDLEQKSHQSQLEPRQHDLARRRLAHASTLVVSQLSARDQDRVYQIDRARGALVALLSSELAQVVRRSGSSAAVGRVSSSRLFSCFF